MIWFFAADRWRKWRGGPRPVSPMTWVEVRYQTGQLYSDEARNLRWKNIGAPSDIVQYRVVL